MIMNVRAARALVVTMLLCVCTPLSAQSSRDELVIRPAKPSVFDQIRVDVPVRTCLFGERAMSIKTTTTHVTENVIALAVEQNGPSACFAAAEGSATKGFTFFIQPLAQGSYTVNFTRAIGATIDLQQTSTFFVSAPSAGGSMPTLPQLGLVLLALILLVTEALVIAVRPNLTFDWARWRRNVASRWSLPSRWLRNS